jgi:endonuclease/exonuclease/phosphatase family metal-dependent hydrolase
VATCALFASVVQGAPAGVSVATWNMNWLLDADTHARWTAACAKHGWPTQTAALSPAARAELAALPYCNVHNGMRFPPDACAATAAQWPHAARYPDAHPCRETADLKDWPRYERKLAALRAMFLELAQAGVTVVALQEVASVAAVTPLLPPGWKVATTHELPDTPRIAQHVGVAWAPGARVHAVTAVPALADGGVPERPLRPGLAFMMDVAGRPVQVLVVHLKAGCRSRAIDAPLTARDARLSPERQDQIASDCAMLRFQIPALEAWIDAHAAVDFAVVGDFNRTLLREPIQDSSTYRSRLDGSVPADPVGPCTMARDGNRLVAQCPAKIAALFPEINDGAPRGATLWRARLRDDVAGNERKAGCSIAGDHGNLAHEGIDHILISASLKRRLTADALTMRAVNYADAQGAPVRAAPELALPSDHCPHVVAWNPEPR